MNDENEDRDLRPDDDADLPQAVFPAETPRKRSAAELWAEFIRDMKKTRRKFLIFVCVCLLLLIGSAVYYVATTDIYQAAYSGDALLVRIHLLLGADVNATKYGSTPLISAIQSGEEEIVKFLLENGADPNHSNSVNDMRPPLLVCVNSPFRESKKYNIALMLIKYGADLNATNHFLQTPLHLAAQKGLPDFAELLIDNGADVNALSIFFRTPLGMIEAELREKPWEKHQKIKTMLIENGAMTFAELAKEPLTPKMKNFYFFLLKSPTYFLWASELISTYPELARMADAESGMTFLHYCVRYGEPYMFNSHGDSITVYHIDIKEFDINALDKSGKTPLDYAVEKGNKKIIEMLKKAGAKTAEELKEEATPPPNTDGAQ